MGSLAALQGCGGDDDDEGTGGGGGTSGSKATGGSAGSATGGKGTGGSGTGGKATGGSAGKGTGGSVTGGTGGTATGGAGGAPGGAGGEGGGNDGPRAAACADYCEAYYDAGCDGFDATNSYESEDHCNAACMAADWGIEGDGNTIECRTTHAGLAAGGDADTHCGHASANSTGICVD